MTRIKRGGRELTVDDSVVAGYLREGYSVIDDHGNEITRGTAQNMSQALRELKQEQDRCKSLAVSIAEANERITELQAERDEAFQENAKLTAKVAELEAELEAAKAEAKPAGKKNASKAPES